MFMHGEAAVFTAEYSGWVKISCAKDGKPRPVEDIAADVLAEALKGE